MIPREVDAHFYFLCYLWFSFSMFRFLPLAALLLAISCADLEIHLKYGATCIMDHGVAIQQSLSIRELISENTTSIDLGGMDIQTFLVCAPFST